MVRASRKHRNSGGNRHCYALLPLLVFAICFETASTVGCGGRVWRYAFFLLTRVTLYRPDKHFFSGDLFGTLELNVPLRIHIIKLKRHESLKAA